MMTVKEIAKLAGVSPASVSLVLNNKKGVSEATREHVKKVLLDNHYTHIAGKKSTKGTIIFLKYSAHGLIAEENQGFISSIINQIETELKWNVYSFSIVGMHPDDAMLVFNRVMSKSPNGIIFLGSELREEQFPLLEQNKIPMVVLDSAMHNCNKDCVLMANDDIIYSAVKHLYALGHREIGYLGSSIPSSNFTDREIAFQRITSDLGLDAEWVLRLTPLLQKSYQEMNAYLKTNGKKLPRGLIAANDMVAIGAMRAILDHGYKIPEDISVVGIDDIPFSAMTNPPLTTVNVSRTTIGSLAVDLLLKRINHPEYPPIRVEVGGELMIRQSTCVCRQQAAVLQGQA